GATRLVGDNSYADPTAAGDQRFRFAPKFVLPAAPCTISMATSRMRFAADAAPWASALPAGTIASRKGSAIVAPIPFRTVRLGRCFFVKYMVLRLRRGGVRGLLGAHLESHAGHHALNKR